MAEITPQMVKTLRERTGAGMGECKKALVESDGDMNGAIEILRKKGAASAAKRAARSANEGMIIARTSENGDKAVIVEVNCETDFVARNAEFIKYAEKVGTAVMHSNANDVETLMQTEVEGEKLEDLHNDILAKFSEKIEVRRFERIESKGYIAEYIHAGSKLGVLIEFSSNKLNETAKALGRDIAMQIAAMNPLYLDRAGVPMEALEKEKEIYRQQALDQGKPAEIANKIAEGRLEKYFTEAVLIDQAFVKDGDKTIKDVVKMISDEADDEVKLVSMRRYLLGEEAV
jgi:elongation factor Ts